MIRKGFFLAVLWTLILEGGVRIGLEECFKEEYSHLWKGKKIGLITNHTGVNSELKSTIDLFLEHDKECTLFALFAPEHGIDGKGHAFEKIADRKHKCSIPIYSLHGTTRRPTPEMLKGVEVLIYDIQDVGSRGYTYATTLFYVMEEAAKASIPVVVLDRPNPLGGNLVDGPMLEAAFRSYIGYVNVPYCHGFTIGELASFFNEEYRVRCKLTVVPMKGWKREMSFQETGLHWIPTSPHIPEEDTPFYSATTGILGELDLVNIGVGYTLPFKVVGAPWIDAEQFAEALNAQKLPGVYFLPFHYKPFYGSYKGTECHGVKIQITNKHKYRPLVVQYFLIGLLKSLYPEKVVTKLKSMSKGKLELFNKATGSDTIYKLLLEEKFIAWKLVEYQKEEREAFLEKRKKYLLY